MHAERAKNIKKTARILRTDTGGKSHEGRKSARTTGGFLAGTRFTDLDRTAVNFALVQRNNRILGRVVFGEFHETEALGATLSRSLMTVADVTSPYTSNCLRSSSSLVE